MERRRMLPAVEAFIDDLRAVCREEPEGEARWRRCAALLGRLLRDPDLRDHARSWPVGGFDGRAADNLLFYVDPDHGFALNGLIKKPGGRAMIHDHGPSWTVYGLLEGAERIVRFSVVDDPAGTRRLEETRAVECGPGAVDLVAPYEIHSEYAGDRKSIAVIVRSRKTGTFRQLGYEDGPEGRPIPGPNQVPYPLTPRSADLCGVSG